MWEEQDVRRRVFRIRRWLLLAVAVLALGLASAAPAQVYGGEGQGRVSGGSGDFVRTTGSPVARTADGFDWGYVTMGIGVGLAAAISGLGLVQLGRNRRRLATLL